MPTSKSAMKRVRTNEKARIRNKSRRSSLRTSEKKIRSLVATSDMDKAKDQLKDIFKKLDKAVVVGTIHKNKANRKKSRLAALLVQK